MDNKKRTPPKLTVGITTIVVVFAVLCLTIFAILSVSTADSEYRLAKKYSESVTAYYIADSACADIAESFRELWESGGDFKTLSVLASSLGVQCVQAEGGSAPAVISYSRDIDSTRALYVQLHIGESFDIKQWQTTQTSEWTPDDSLPVWTGDGVPD